MSSDEDLTRNVLYALDRIAPAKAKAEALAGELGVNRSTITRWRSMRSTPREPSVRLIAEKSGIEKALFFKTHREFVSVVTTSSMKQPYENVDPKIEFRAIAKWRHLWDECFERHRGTYFVYNEIRPRASGQAATLFAVSLLQIQRKTEQGIVFELHNVDTRNTDSGSPDPHYVYTGLMFPVLDILCFYGEEKSGDELLNMITASSQTSPPTLLRGHLVAVGVTPSIRMATGNQIALGFRRREIVEYSKIKEEIGVFAINRMPRSVHNILQI